MGKLPVQKNHNRKSLIAGRAKPLLSSLYLNKRLEFSFLHLDESQGQTGRGWEENGILSQALLRFKSISSLDYWPPFNEKFKTYDCWPAKTKYRWPGSVPEDATWASMHIQGKECVIGHIVDNVFYVVFFDADHQFWPTEKRNT